MGLSFSVEAGAAYGGVQGVGYMPAPGQSVGDAAYGVAHGHPGGIGALAVRMGKSANTLTHKVNPLNDTHHLTLQEAVDMQALSGNAAVLHAMAAVLGYTCVRATPDTSQGDPLDCMATLQMHQADLARAVADAVRSGPGTVTANALRRVQHQAEEAIAATSHAVAMVRGHVRAAPGGVE